MQYNKGNYKKALPELQSLMVECIETLTDEQWSRVTALSAAAGDLPDSKHHYHNIDAHDNSNFVNSVEQVSVDDSVCAVTSIVLFNLAQTMRQMKNYRGALQCYQRAFFMNPKTSNRILLSILNNMDELMSCMVGKQDAKMLMRRCLGTSAEQQLEKHRRTSVTRSEDWETSSSMSSILGAFGVLGPQPALGQQAIIVLWTSPETVEDKDIYKTN